MCIEELIIKKFKQVLHLLGFFEGFCQYHIMVNRVIELKTEVSKRAFFQFERILRIIVKIRLYGLRIVIEHGAIVIQKANQLTSKFFRITLHRLISLRKALIAL